jgi:phospholipid-binding lipoprotein MlaA
MNRSVLIWALFWVFALVCIGSPARADVPESPILLAQKSQNASKTSDSQEEEEYDYEEEEEAPAIHVADPFHDINMFFFYFNDRLYFWALKPAARGYKAVVPVEIRTAVQNFFYNLRFPIRFVNCLLQAKGAKASEEFARFFINTTVGFLGIGEPSRAYPNLNPSPEDLGQTLGYWGLGNGFYIVYPFLGPYTLRDSARFIDSYFLDPVGWLDTDLKTRLAIDAYDYFNTASFHIGDYEALKEAAIDPYVAVRNAYLQYRQKLINE